MYRDGLLRAQYRLLVMGSHPGKLLRLDYGHYPKREAGLFLRPAL